MSKTVQLSSVIIDSEKIELIKAAIAQLQNYDTIFNQWGFDQIFEKGTAVSLLFHGIPGTGKTLMAQAIADYLSQDLVVIGSGDIETSEPGGAERAIKRFFTIANVRVALSRNKDSNYIKEQYGVDIYNDPETIKNPMTGEDIEVPKNDRLHGNCQILLFDECDSLLTSREKVGVILSAQVNALLSELERFEGVVIFTTNRIDQLDMAMERRITAKIEFEFPDKSQRLQIWRRMIPQRAPIHDDVNFEELAEFEMVGGNIKNVVLNAAREAAYSGLGKITHECFLKAIEKELEGLEQFNKQINKSKDMFKKEVEVELKENMDLAGGIQITKQKSVKIKRNKVKTKTKKAVVKKARKPRKKVVKAKKRGRPKKKK